MVRDLSLNTKKQTFKIKMSRELSQNSALFEIIGEMIFCGKIEMITT